MVSDCGEACGYLGRQGWGLHLQVKHRGWRSEGQWWKHSDNVLTKILQQANDITWVDITNNFLFIRLTDRWKQWCATFVPINHFAFLSAVVFVYFKCKNFSKTSGILERNLTKPLYAICPRLQCWNYSNMMSVKVWKTEWRLCCSFSQQLKNRAESLPL